jgi:thiol-disulfide isomerase/thioredoxin
VVNDEPFDEAALAGKVVVVEEWGVNCPPCIASLTELAKLAKSNAKKGLVVVGSERQNSPKEAILKVLKSGRVVGVVFDQLKIHRRSKRLTGTGFPFRRHEAPSRRDYRAGRGVLRLAWPLGDHPRPGGGEDVLPREGSGHPDMDPAYAHRDRCGDFQQS